MRRRLWPEGVREIGAGSARGDPFVLPPRWAQDRAVAFRQEQQRRSVVVASARATADAEFIKLTLAVHGVTATVSAASIVFPSLDFVEGAYVFVGDADADRAREVLGSLGLSRDELEAPESETEPEPGRA